MKQEIERKFLVRAELLPALGPGRRLAQGYLSFAPTVRVRTEVGPGIERRAYLTIKGRGLVARDEFEYEIPFDEAEAMLEMCQGSVVTKTRHEVPADGSDGLVWEIDVFDGANQGLITAEIELSSPEQAFPRPEWLGEDVSRDPAYKNALLAQRPFSTW